MTLRPPRHAEALLRVATGASELEVEILAEKSAALGRAGSAVEQALARLGRCAADDPERRALAFAAADAVQAWFIQRELMGMRSHAEAVARMSIPREVLAKVGAKP